MYQTEKEPKRKTAKSSPVLQKERKKNNTTRISTPVTSELEEDRKINKKLYQTEKEPKMKTAKSSPVLQKERRKNNNTTRIYTLVTSELEEDKEINEKQKSRRFHNESKK